MTVTPALLARRIAQARRHEPADLVVKNARLLNLADGTLEPTDIAICGDTVVGLYAAYRGIREIDAEGRIAVPGFIDTHVHVESTMVAPDQFERLVLPRGTTTAICDPHEIGNVLGVPGISYVLDCALALRMTLRVQLSSCVPASPLETSGACLLDHDLLPLVSHPAALGLAEMMNYPGVLAADPACLAKLAAFAELPIDGHAPLLGGLDLNAYLACGIRTDHEATREDEAREKLRKGMHVCMREGSASKDVERLAGLLDDTTWPFVSFCTDDRNPLEIVCEGHIDCAIRKAIAKGAPPLAAYRAATLAAARAFRLHDRGLTAPGRRADLVLLDDLETCKVGAVLIGGRPAEEVLAEPAVLPPAVGYRSVKRGPVRPEDFEIRAPGPSGPVIGVIPHALLTERLTLELPWADGRRRPDPTQQVHAVAVLERHGRNGNIGRAFVRGFGPMRGALATSIGHDSHNITVVGADETSMATAANRVIATQGGLVAAEGETCLAELALPLAGLMSDRPYEEVTPQLEWLLAAARALGCALDEPFLQMAFLPLAVIPHLKVTDMGLVDVDKFALIAA
jgi:adenine deaminase